jgi:hypothetical protein
MSASTTQTITKFRLYARAQKKQDLFQGLALACINTLTTVSTHYYALQNTAEQHT